MRLTIFLALILTISGTANAQGRGQRGAAPGGGARGSSSIEHAAVSADRNVTVYLPPNYASDSARRFPVIYFLPDSKEPADDVINGIKEAADKLSPLQGFSEPIVVASNSDSESFIAEELVAYIDSHYRTLAKRISRGLTGHASGALSAFRIGMKRTDVFSSLYLMSASGLTDTNSALEQYVANPKKHYTITIEIGKSDASLAANRQLHETMLRLHIPHFYEEYEGGQRYERNLLPFFSRNLAAPANPTSPTVQ